MYFDFAAQSGLIWGPRWGPVGQCWARMRPLKGIEKAAKIKVHVYFDFAVHLGLNLGPTQGLHGQSWAKISPLKRIEKAAKIKVHCTLILLFIWASIWSQDGAQISEDEARKPGKEGTCRLKKGWN